MISYLLHFYNWWYHIWINLIKACPTRDDAAWLYWEIDQWLSSQIWAEEENISSLRINNYFSCDFRSFSKFNLVFLKGVNFIRVTNINFVCKNCDNNNIQNGEYILSSDTEDVINSLWDALLTSSYFSFYHFSLSFLTNLKVRSWIFFWILLISI